MRNFFVTLMTSLLSCSAAFAFWPEAVDSNLEIGVGYRHDSFKWTTSADTFDSDSGVAPGVLFPVGIRSELKWKNLRIWQIEARGDYVTCDNIYLRGYADYGWITRGRNTDVDFVSFGGSGYSNYSDSSEPSILPIVGGDGNSEFSSSHSRSRKGHVYDGSIGIGYQFKMCDDSFALSPLVGYSWHGQHLNINHGRHSDQCSYDYNSSSSSSSSSNQRLHSKYRARWNGPWIGFDFDYKFCWCCSEWSIYGGYEYHWARYHASADWNLRTDLPNGFHHRAKRADGSIVTIGGRWDFCDNWTVGIKGQFQWWHARHGRDRALLSENEFGDIKTKCFTTIPLRNVRWNSESVSIDIGMAF